MATLAFTQRLKGLADTQVQRAHEQLANATDGVIAALNRSFSLTTGGITALLPVTADLKLSTNHRFTALQGYLSGNTNTGTANWLSASGVSATWVAPYAGSVAAVSGWLFCSAATAGQTFTTGVVKSGNTLVTTTASSFNGATPVYFRQVFTPGASPFAAGDVLQLLQTVSASLGAVTISGNIHLTVYA